MTIKVPFEADTGRAQRNIDKLNRSISRTGSTTQKAAGTSSRAFRGMAKAAALAAGAVGSVVGAVKGIGAADRIDALNNRISAFSDSSSEAASRMQDVVRVSRDQFQSLDAIGTLYSRLQVSTKRLGTSQAELAEFTEAFAAGARVTSASAQEASAAATQLSQGLASGVLRGEEFNSVMEQTPRVAQALADGLGVGVGELRKLSQAGELTAGKVIPALNSQLATLREESGRIPPTLSEIRNGFNTSFALASSQIDKTTGALSGIKGAIKSATTGLDNFAKTLRGGGSLGLALADSIIRGARNGVSAIVKLFKSIDFSGLASSIGKAIGLGLRGLISFFANIKVSDLSGFVGALKDGAVQFATVLFTNVSSALDGIDFARFGLRMADTLINGMGSFIAGVSNTMGTLINKLIEAVNKVAKLLPGFDGIDFRAGTDLEAPKSNLEGAFKGKGNVFEGSTGAEGGEGTNPLAAFFASITGAAENMRKTAQAAADAAEGAGGKDGVAKTNLDLATAGESASSAIAQLANITGNRALQALDDFIGVFSSVNSLFTEFGKLLGSMGGGGGDGIGGFIAGLFSTGAQAGGVVVPGSGIGDSVPAMLEPGEIVIPNRASDREALLGSGGGMTVNIGANVDEQARTLIRRMVQTGELQQLQNASNVQNGASPVFKAA